MSRPVIRIPSPLPNAFELLAVAREAYLSYQSGVGTELGIANRDWAVIRDEATSGDYDHLIETLRGHFEVTA